MDNTTVVANNASNNGRGGIYVVGRSGQGEFIQPVSTSAPGGGTGLTVTLAHAEAVINADRLLNNWEMLSGFRDPDLPGWTRRPFSPWYHQARAWLSEQMSAAGLATEVDAAANLIGRRAGGSSGRAPLVIGSHTDTVTGGGRFDGIVGMLSAIEVAHSLDEAGLALQHPLEVIDYLAEEPTDFGISTGWQPRSVW